MKVQQSAAGPKSERAGEAFGESHGAYSRRDYTTLSKPATRAQVANRVAEVGIRLALISPLSEKAIAVAAAAADRAVSYAAFSQGGWCSFTRRSPGRRPGFVTCGGSGAPLNGAGLCKPSLDRVARGRRRANLVDPHRLTRTVDCFLGRHHAHALGIGAQGRSVAVPVPRVVAGTTGACASSRNSFTP